MTKKWNIERSFYDKQVSGYDPKTKKETYWPYQNIEEKSHKEWLKQVQDPVTKQFFKGRAEQVEYDNEGKEIPSTKKIIELEPRYEITQIIRIRTRDRQEFLYSRGLMYGYNNFQNEVSHKFQEPEKWDEQKFAHHTEFIQRLNTTKDICDGPSGRPITHYTLPWTTDNVDKLMQNAIPNVKLILKDEGSTMAKQCTDVEMFKTKPFDYIFNDEWQSVEEREKAKI